MSGSYWGAPADSVTPTIRSPQTSLSQCSFNPTLIPIHFGFSGQELLQRARLHGGEKARLDLGRISEHSPLSFTLGTQDGNIPFSGFAGWLYIQAGQLHTNYSSDFFGDACCAASNRVFSFSSRRPRRIWARPGKANQEH